jgi:hypothetical protein
LGFSILFTVVKAQVTPTKPAAPKTDSAVKKPAEKAPAPVLPDSIYYEPNGLRLGIDLSRILIKAFQPYRTDITFYGDYRLNKKLYAAAEVGWQTVSHSDSNYTYKGNGAFMTVGVDYNFQKKQPDLKERFMFYGGLRYGFAHLSYEAPSYTIYDSYWGDRIPGSFPKVSASAHWVELLIGIKAEVLKNFFLGWNIREKIMVSGPKSDVFPPIVIPGYGNGVKGSQFDWQYTVSYMIPLGDIKLREPRKQ